MNQVSTDVLIYNIIPFLENKDIVNCIYVSKDMKEQIYKYIRKCMNKNKNLEHLKKESDYITYISLLEKDKFVNKTNLYRIYGVRDTESKINHIIKKNSHLYHISTVFSEIIKMYGSKENFKNKKLLNGKRRKLSEFDILRRNMEFQERNILLYNLDCLSRKKNENINIMHYFDMNILSLKQLCKIKEKEIYINDKLHEHGLDINYDIDNICYNYTHNTNFVTENHVIEQISLIKYWYEYCPEERKKYPHLDGFMLKNNKNDKNENKNNSNYDYNKTFYENIITIIKKPEKYPWK